MRECPGCGYLVPATWGTCKRCGADVASTDVSVAAPALARAAALPGAGALGETPPPSVRRAPVGPAARPAPPPVPVAGATFGVSEYQQNVKIGAGLGSAAPLLAPRRRRGRAVAALVLVAVLGAAGWFAKDLVLPDSLPPRLEAYVDGEPATTYRSAAGEFEVELPRRPRETSQAVPAGGAELVVVQATAVTGDAALSVSYVDLPRGSVLDPRVTLEGGAEGAAAAAGGEVIEHSPTTHQGYPALDARFETPHGEGRIRLVLVRDRLYSATVVGPYDGAPGFERLVTSLRVG